MRNLLIAIAFAVPASAPVAASESADVIATVHRWADAFTRRSFDTDIAPCAADAVVIDDLPPHVWQGPTACSMWFKAFEAWASKAGATGATLTVGEIRHLDIDGDVAYLVGPVTLSYIRADKPVNFPGLLTMTLRKRGFAWQVSGLAWADQ